MCLGPRADAGRPTLGGLQLWQVARPEIRALRDERFEYALQRLVRAFHLLKKPDMTIGDVADAAGYRDAGSFSKAFKLRFGFLPSDLRAGRAAGKTIIQE